MQQLYTVFFIRKQDGRLLRRYVSSEYNRFFWEQTKLQQLRVVLDKYIDLEKSDILIKDFVGDKQNWDD